MIRFLILSLPSLPDPYAPARTPASKVRSADLGASGWYVWRPGGTASRSCSPPSPSGSCINWPLYTNIRSGYYWVTKSSTCRRWRQKGKKIYSAIYRFMYKAAVWARELKSLSFEALRVLQTVNIITNNGFVYQWVTKNRACRRRKILSKEILWWHIFYCTLSIKKRHNRNQTKCTIFVMFYYSYGKSLVK